MLAAAAAADPQVRAYFPGGVFWVTAGEAPDLAGLQAGLLARLGAAGAAPRSAAEGAGLLRRELAGRQVLLVVDDVWSAAAAQAFRVTGCVAGCCTPPGTRWCWRLSAPPPNGSASARRPATARPPRRAEDALLLEADRVLAATGRVAWRCPGGRRGRGGATWPQVAELDRGIYTFLDHPYANTFKALQAATAALIRPGRRLYHLGGVPAGHPVPVAAVSRYWGRLRAEAEVGLAAGNGHRPE